MPPKYPSVSPSIGPAGAQAGFFIASRQSAEAALPAELDMRQCSQRFLPQNLRGSP